MTPRRSVPASLVLLLACGDAGTAATDPADSDASSSSGAAEPTTSTSTTDVSTSSTDDSTTTTTSTATSTADPSTTGPAPLIVTTDVVRYTSQPQVVDVLLTTSAAANSLTLVHPDDPGVVIEPIAVDAQTTTFRVRGLAPDTNHSLQYTADDVTGPVDFITFPPLLGFIPSFEVQGGSVDPAAPYRLFDLIPFPAFDTASVFMVDAMGTTRWHLGGPSTNMPGPEGVWTSVKPRPDGTLMYLHNHTMWIRDELGEPALELPDDLLGLTGLHHELLTLPNGNFMALSFVFKDIDYGQPGVLTTAGDLIVEFTPDGEVVWTWDSFDHLDPQRVTEPFDTATVIHPITLELTYDWTHGNAIVHDPVTDTLLLSLRHQDWILAIDHKTGEVLWKLGDDGDFDLLGDSEWFFHQHAPEWQQDGTLLLYDNGLGNPDLAPADVHSRAVRYSLDLEGMTAQRVWTDDGPPILVTYAGNADRLPGGRVLATDSSILGPGGIWAQLRELDESASPMLQWSLRTPDQTFAYRATAHDRLIGQPAP